MIIKANDNQAETVKYIVHKTIDKIYPRYYPKGAVEFFKAHHNNNSIMKDIRGNMVFILKEDDILVGTVTIKENEILRLFVLPEYQHKGFGRKLLDYAEKIISREYHEILIDASLPAKKIYKLRGYVEIEYNQILTESVDVLCYDVMTKEC